MDDNTTTENSSDLPTYTGSLRTITAHQAYRRVRRVIQLQWRGVAIVLLIIGDVIFFSVVFVSMDNGIQLTPEKIKQATPWLLCLVGSGGDKNQCLPLVKNLVKHESIVLAVLVILGVCISLPFLIT